MTLNDLSPRLRELAWWALPLGALLVVLGVEIRLGDAAVQAPAAVAANGAKPVAPSLLPEYSIPGGTDSRSETVNRTLFNPTRRPAPTPAQEAPKPQMPRGQFALTGTTVVEGKSTAFLREVNGGKFRRVNQGDTLNGMVVAEVRPDRVKLTMGDETEELVLKVVPNPKPTPGMAPAGVPQVAAVPGATPPGTAAAPVQNAGQSLLERRRAARAAAAAAAGQGGQPGVPETPDGTPRAPGMPARPDAANRAAQINAERAAERASAASAQPAGTWADVFRSYQQRAVPNPGR